MNYNSFVLWKIKSKYVKRKFYESKRNKAYSIDMNDKTTLSCKFMTCVFGKMYSYMEIFMPQ